MGRTLHYNIKKINGSNFTKKEMQKICEVNNKYASEPFSKLWTCEWFDLDPTSSYPNWDKFADHKTFDEFYKGKHKELKDKGFNHFEIFNELVKKGFIIPVNESKRKVGGFTKTQGNELNSLMVLQALIEISNAVPKGEIYVSDEGRFLLAPLKIRNGKAIPVLNEVLESIQYQCFRMCLSSKFEGNILSKLKNTDFMTDQFKKDAYIDNSYGDMSKYVDDCLLDLQEIEKRLIKKLHGHHLHFFNIENMNPKEWLDPMLFTRKVDIEKFTNYELSPATLMDGFDGEGFGLAKGDSEYDSYKAIADIQKVVEKMGFAKENLKVLGEK